MMPTVTAAIRRLLFVSAAATAAVMLACTENIPMGPSAFSATVAITSLPDTILVADTKTISAVATDAAGNKVSNLTYSWTVGDTGVLGLGASDSASGRTRTVSAKRPGVSSVTLHLPDARFVAVDASKNVRAVIARLQITTSHDTTITAMGDTLMVRASAYVKSGATTVAYPLSGLTWSIRSSGGTSFTASGDSVRIIAFADGVDSIIVAHPYCLAGARCADTALVRVREALKLTLATNNLSAWSFGDTVSSAATVKDRHGRGKGGTYLRFFPKAAADSAVVTVTPLFGLNQPTSGNMAVARFIAQGNGTARVVVQAYNAADVLFDTSSVAVKVRQLAARSTVFPLVSSVTHGDSIPLRARVIDARGSVIDDATVALTPVSGTLSGYWAIGAAPSTAAMQMVWARVTGASVADSNPGAPAVTMARDTAVVQSLPPMTVVAGADSAAKILVPKVLTYGAAPVPAAWVRHIRSGGVTTADSTSTDLNGIAQVTWRLPTTVGTYRFTALQRQGTTVPVTAADSAGLILVRRTVRVIAAAAYPVTTTVTPADSVLALAGTTQLSVVANDLFGNLTTTIAPADITATAKFGTVGAWGCTGNVCTATYTAPTTVVSDTVSAKISGVHLLGSPFQVRTKPGAPSAATSTAAAASTTVTASTFTTITVTIRDVNGNVVTTAGPADFVAAPSQGTFFPWFCVLGVCRGAWVAPATSPTSATIIVMIGGVNVLGSPIVITVP
jgi:hypothetical protein